MANDQNKIMMWQSPYQLLKIYIYIYILTCRILSFKKLSHLKKNFKTQKLLKTKTPISLESISSSPLYIHCWSKLEFALSGDY